MAKLNETNELYPLWDGNLLMKFLWWFSISANIDVSMNDPVLTYCNNCFPYFNALIKPTNSPLLSSYSLLLACLAVVNAAILSRFLYFSPTFSSYYYNLFVSYSYFKGRSAWSSATLSLAFLITSFANYIYWLTNYYLLEYADSVSFYEFELSTYNCFKNYNTRS